MMDSMSGSASSMPMNPSQMGGGMNAPAYFNAMGSMDPNAAANMANHGVGMTGYGSQGIFGGGLDLNTLITGILNFGIKLFLLLLVVGLVIGTFVYLKKYLSDNGSVAGFLGTEPKVVCTSCGTTLKKEWNCCPNCGKARVTVPAAAEVQTV